LTACTKEKQTLTVGIMPDLDSIPFVVAKEQGYLKENIILEIYKSPVDRDSAFYSGHLNGTISDVLAACIAKEGGFPVFITSKTNGRYGLVTTQASGITSAKMLEGKEVGLSLNTIIEYVTDTVVAAEGGDPSLVTKVSVPKIPSRLELLQNNQIDAVAMPEPYVTAAATAGHVILNTSEALNINPGVMLFTAEAVETKAAEIKALYEAYDKAVEYIETHSKEAFMPQVIEELGLPQTAEGVQLPVYEKMTLPEEQEVVRAMEWLKNKELLKNTYTYNDLVVEMK
jgi:NitT/TauT family transport system substrate-binding protein